MSDLLFDISVKFEFNTENRYKLYVKLAQLLTNGVSLDVALQQLERIAKRKSTKFRPTRFWWPAISAPASCWRMAAS